MAERAHPEDPNFFSGQYKQKLYERYEWANNYVKGKDILDIPCGCGWGTSMLKGYKSCVGEDIDLKSINYANEHYMKDNCIFLLGDMTKICKAEKYDVIICLEGYEHIKQEDGIKFLEQARIALKPEGLLLLTCPVIPIGGKHSGNPYHLYEPNEIDLIMILSSRFRVLSLKWQKTPDNPIYRAVLQRR